MTTTKGLDNLTDEAEQRLFEAKLRLSNLLWAVMNIPTAYWNRNGKKFVGIKGGGGKK